MRKQTLKAVTMLISIIALAFATAVAATAQSRSQKIRADIPFDFVVGDKTLAAGEYVVGSLTSTTSEGLAISSSDGNHRALRLTNAVISSAPKPSMLIFHRYGNTYFLAQVWTQGATEGRELVRSKAERSAERELASNARPEVVTVSADVE
jgi:hypothetical protein